MVGKARDILHSSIGRGPLAGITSGTVVTVLVQSSSTTTSLMVPLVGNGVLTAKDIYPFTLGANIGTCITALIAALAITGDNAALALQIALVHLLYNVSAVVVIYGIVFLRNLPLNLSYQLSEKVSERKILGVAYIAGMFFVLPLSIIFATQ
jgi:sodium-dependent phosphate cotransporter